MSPIIDLYKTGISKIDKVDLEFIKIVLNEHESIDFLTTSISKKRYLKRSMIVDGFSILNLGTGAREISYFPVL